MTVGEIIALLSGGSFGVMTILELSKIKVNPWTAIARWLGRAINGELLKSIEDLKKEVNDIKENAEEQVAVDCRARILRFGDEMMHNFKHSKDHFDQTLLDIKIYERYCEEHPEFENNITELTSERIVNVYRARLEDNDFL